MKKLLYCLLMSCVVFVAEARTIYITRHGQVGDRNCYDKEVREAKLTPLGEEQAQAVAAYLVEKRQFKGAVLVSPLLRTIQTGSYTAKMLHKPVILEPGIQELNEGNGGGGMTLAQIKERFGEDAVPGPAFKEPWRVKNENSSARAQRLSDAWARILKEQQGDLLLVGHGASVVGLAGIIRKMLPKGAKQVKETAWNCCLFIITLDDEDKPIAMEYTTEYLPDEKITSNFSCPKVERPDDPRYLTRQQSRELNKKRAAARAKREAEQKAKATQAGNAAEAQKK